MIGAIGWPPLFDFLTRADPEARKAVQARETRAEDRFIFALIGSPFAAVALLLLKVNPGR